MAPGVWRVSQVEALDRTFKDIITVATIKDIEGETERARALEMLMQAHGSVKAYDLIAEFQPGGRTTPPTVYRALDALVELGLAHKISSMNAYVACTRHAHPHHAASFLFCDCCGSVEEFEAPVGEVVNAIKAQSAFHLNEMTLEVHGLCAPCQAGHPTGR